MYRKVIVSGGVLEVYSYQKPPKDNTKEFEGYEGLLDRVKGESGLGVDRKESRRKQTVRDARNLTRRLALMNFNSRDKFITLTYAENMQCLERADNDFKKFIMRLKYQYGIKKLKYLAVRERQKRGAIHFHILCDWDVELKDEGHIRELERHVAEKIWGFGFVDIKPIGHVDNVGAYLVKYMTKNLSVELYKGKKMYLCSRGLERPVVYSGEEAEALIKAYELDNEKEVFTNSYESEYLGEITYKEYNMSRFVDDSITQNDV